MDQVNIFKVNMICLQSLVWVNENVSNTRGDVKTF